MEIPVGKYVITSDSNNIILNEKKKHKTGKNAGEESLSPVAFFFNITSCMEHIINEGIRESQATSLKELMAEVEKIRKRVEKALKGV